MIEFISIFLCASLNKPIQDIEWDTDPSKFRLMCQSFIVMRASFQVHTEKPIEFFSTDKIQ